MKKYIVKILGLCSLKKLHCNQLVITDGHTRAYQLYLLGVDEIKVYWDEYQKLWIDRCKTVVGSHQKFE